MDFIKKLKLIERIDGMISRKSTGTPTELSKKIEVSERTLYNIIAIMKKLGAPIYYSSSRMSYCYNGTVSFSYVFNIVDEENDTQETSDFGIKTASNNQQSTQETKQLMYPEQRVYNLPMRLEDTGTHSEY